MGQQRWLRKASVLAAEAGRPGFKYPASMSELHKASFDCNPSAGEERQVDPESLLANQLNPNNKLTVH